MLETTDSAFRLCPPDRVQSPYCPLIPGDEQAAIAYDQQGEKLALSGIKLASSYTRFLFHLSGEGNLVLAGFEQPDLVE